MIHNLEVIGDGKTYSLDFLIAQSGRITLADQKQAEWIKFSCPVENNGTARVGDVWTNPAQGFPIRNDKSETFPSCEALYEFSQTYVNVPLNNVMSICWKG
jgi:hypothetical protein